MNIILNNLSLLIVSLKKVISNEDFPLMIKRAGGPGIEQYLFFSQASPKVEYYFYNYCGEGGRERGWGDVMRRV